MFVHHKQTTHKTVRRDVNDFRQKHPLEKGYLHSAQPIGLHSSSEMVPAQRNVEFHLHSCKENNQKSCFLGKCSQTKY